ncbi:IQ-DOMAIN 14-like [Ancistrocladus abbreviatus]
MGRKGSWFSAIKKVFLPNSKEKVGNVSEKKTSKDKKKVLGKLKRGETRAFIPLFREPSSVEKILGDAEREHHPINFRPLTPVEQPKPLPLEPSRSATPLKPVVSSRAHTGSASPPPPATTTPRWVPSPAAAAPPARSAACVSAPSPPPARPPPTAATPSRAASPRFVYRPRPEPTLRNHHACATKIQAAYRGYAARRSYRSLRGLMRLQAVMKGPSVKRQTVNAMKCMQLLVRVQSQIQSRRIQSLENQALKHQALCRNDNDLESSFGKWNLNQADEWDDSVLTKEEIEARMQRKVDAIEKRERAMAYAYSHELWKVSPRAPEAGLMDIGSVGFPWWWNWLERQTPMTPLPKPSESPAMKNFHLTPPMHPMELKASPLSHSSDYPQPSPVFDNLDTPTPRLTRTPVPTRTRLGQTPTPGRKFIKPRVIGVASSPFNDDDSLTSCPPFSVPRYMEPTVSAKAKVKGSTTPPVDESKRRLSFLMPQGIGSFKWSKGTFFGIKETSSQRLFGKNQSLQSIGSVSVDSTISMPAIAGRRPFNRFV